MRADHRVVLDQPALPRLLHDEALRRGAGQVYAASRQPVGVGDERVRPVVLDVTDQAQIREAADVGIRA
jgi:hypothetical protein